VNCLFGSCVFAQMLVAYQLLCSVPADEAFGEMPASFCHAHDLFGGMPVTC
jgi:hypothetical protein